MDEVIIGQRLITFKNTGFIPWSMVKKLKKEVKKAVPKAKMAAKKPVKVSKEKEEYRKTYPDEEQGIVKEKSRQQKEEEIEAGEKDEDIYTKEGRNVIEEEGEVEPWEEGFMEGASDLGQLGKDGLTGQPIMGAENVIELEFQGKMYRFVSEKNAEEFMKRRQKKKK